MSSKELVEKFINEVELGNFTQASNEYLSEDFKVDLPIALPINIGKYQIGMVLDLVKKSIPDFKLNFKAEEETETSVKGSVKFTGKFEFSFSIPGLSSVIPATNQEINLPEANLEFKLNEGKIISLGAVIPNFQDLIAKLMSNPSIPNMGNLSDMAKNAGINIPPFKL